MGKREDAFTFLDAVSGLLLGHWEAELLETPPYYAPILGWYSRSRNLFDATAILLRDDHAEAAWMLGRSLFTESLWLMKGAAAADETTRAGLAFGWVIRSYTNDLRVIHAGHDVGIWSEEELQELLAANKAAPSSSTSRASEDPGSPWP